MGIFSKSTDIEIEGILDRFGPVGAGDLHFEYEFTLKGRHDVFQANNQRTRTHMRQIGLAREGDRIKFTVRSGTPTIARSIVNLDMNIVEAPK